MPDNDVEAGMAQIAAQMQAERQPLPVNFPPEMRERFEQGVCELYLRENDPELDKPMTSAKYARSLRLSGPCRPLTMPYRAPTNTWQRASTIWSVLPHRCCL